MSRLGTGVLNRDIMQRTLNYSCITGLYFGILNSFNLQSTRTEGFLPRSRESKFMHPPHHIPS